MNKTLLTLFIASTTCNYLSCMQSLIPKQKTHFEEIGEALIKLEESNTYIHNLKPLIIGQYSKYYEETIKIASQLLELKKFFGDIHDVEDQKEFAFFTRNATILSTLFFIAGHRILSLLSSRANNFINKHAQAIKIIDLASIAVGLITWMNYQCDAERLKRYNDTLNHKKSLEAIPLSFFESNGQNNNNQQEEPLD